MEQYVVFKSHQQHFALRIDYVVRVIEAASFTQLPEVADFVLGIQPIEEAMVPIIDIRKSCLMNLRRKPDKMWSCCVTGKNRRSVFTWKRSSAFYP